MLISPPFLPATNGPADDNWLNEAMTNANNEGAYPVTRGLAWHGGMHLVSPANILVRAIADGTVAYVRKATAKNDNENDPLNYHAGRSLAGWTSDGCVIIRHDTEIGEGDNSNVRFFSIYMHLKDIPADITKNKAIYRKDSIGKAGYINGQASRIHFEIICDDANIAKLVGRSAGDTAINADGRSDAVYGDMYFHLPPGTPLFAAKPPTQPAANTIAPVPIHTTSADLFVGIRYAGHGYVTTYQSNGTIVGKTSQEDDFEYTLYKKATELHTQCPSAAYELLRFGRVLGPDALAPADTPHWRQVCYPGGQGWANLAPATIRKFSDADFPHWRGWTLIDDSADLNSRMDAPVIRDWLDTDHDGKVTPDEARSQLLTLEVQNKLKGAICRLPTEWNAATIDARWDWLKTVTPEHPEKLDNEDFEELKRHISKLCFWEDANLGIDANHWHFDPREFIRHFRKCGWLSGREFKQMVPTNALRRHAGSYLWETVRTNLNTPQSVAISHHVPLNKMMRKYCINSPLRMASFFGNAIQETVWLGSLAEASGATLWYAPWYGRGFLQLTNPANYTDYWLYRGRSVPTALKTALEGAYRAIARLPVAQRSNATLRDALFPALTAEMREWREQIQASPATVEGERLYAPSDSAGFYWASLKMAMYADAPHHLERQVVATNHGAKIYYRSSSFWRASAAVNLPGAINNTYSNALNGFDARCVAYGYALAVLCELNFPNANGTLTLPFPEGYTPRR
jgi:hypothetical protein